MSLELYLAFVAATTLLIVIPGPTVTLVVAHSLTHGSRRAMRTVLGGQAAQAIQLGLVALGMTTLIHALATWFDWLRWAGVLYLIWLGIQRWRSRAAAAEPGEPVYVPGRALFWHGFLVSATNPKVWLFYAAFFPQFIDPAAPLALQLAVLSATFLTIGFTLDSSYALLAGRLGAWLRIGARRRVIDRLTGTLLIGTGLWLAAMRRT